MTNNTFTNMKDLENSLIERGTKMVKDAVNKFIEKWGQENIGYQQFPCYGDIINNYEKIIDINASVLNGAVKVSFSIGNINEFNSVYTNEDDTTNRNIYESFLNDFEGYCINNGLLIKRV